MEKKRLTKYLWYGSDVDSEGNPIVPDVSAEGDHLSGLNEGEVYIHNHPDKPALYIRTTDGNVVPIGAGNVEDLEKVFLRKDRDDRSRGVVASDKGFEAGDFVSGATGAAVYKDKQGAWHIETDNLHVRRKFSANDVEIQTTNYIGGQTMLSAASMRIDSVEELADRYRCLFRKKNGEGDVVKQEWKVGDCAYCNTFNLELQADGTMGNHFFWREVVGVSKNDWNDEFHYVELSKSICAGGSSAPKSGDKVVHLGYNKTDDVDRQNAIVIAGAGTGSPYIQLFVGIENFILPEPEQLKPGDNRLSGVLSIKSGSTGWQNLSGLPDSIQNAVDLANKAQETIDNTSVGAVNLLRNSGFTGDYQSEDMIAPDHLDNGSELFSRKLDKWDGDAVVYTDANGLSGYSAQLGGLSQSVKELIVGETYVVSFKARGTAVNVSCGDFSVEQNLTAVYAKYVFKFKFSGSKVFSIEGNARICDLQLERGTIATDWNASPYDNDKAFAEFQSIKYLHDAIVNGNTTVLGGLILSSILKLGNYKNGKMQKVNAGVSGICNDENDVAFWGGGTFEQAIFTIMKFKQNPNFRPTEEQWADMANFVVSHGGDLFLRCSVYAENGYFRGRLEQGNEATVLEKDGSGHIANENIRWTKEGIMYRRSPDVIEWVNVEEFKEGEINYDKGTFFDLSVSIESGFEEFTLKTPEMKDFPISISLKRALSRRVFSATLYGLFNIRVFDEDANEYKPLTCNRLSIDDDGAREYNLVWNGQSWDLTEGYAVVKNGTAYLGLETVRSTKRETTEDGEDVVSRVVVLEGKIVSSDIETPEKSFLVKEEGKNKCRVEIKMGTDKSLRITKDTEKIEMLEENKKSVLEVSYWKRFGELTSWVKALFRRYSENGSIAAQMESSPDQIKLENFEDAENDKVTTITPEKIETSGFIKALTQIIVGKSESEGVVIKPNNISVKNSDGFALLVDKSARVVEKLHVGGVLGDNTIINGGKITGGTATFNNTGDEALNVAGGIKASKLSLTGSVAKNLFLASPTGASGAPVFRGIADDDIDGLKGLKSDVGTLKTDVSTLKSDVSTLKTNVGALQTTTTTLRTDLNSANTEINTLKESVTKITSAIERIEERVKALEDAASDTGGES